MTTTKYRTGMRMSLDEFLSFDETDGKWELDDGVLYIMASGTPDHQFLHTPRFSRGISTITWMISRQPPAQFYHEMTTILSRELRRAPEPDIVIILDERPRRSGGPHGVEAPPDIASREYCPPTAIATWYANGRYMPRRACWSTGPLTLATTQ